MDSSYRLQHFPISTTDGEPDHQTIDPMQLLPVELCVHLLRFLPDDDLCRACQVSRLWRRLTTSCLDLMGRRRRQVAFMRHLWSSQRQNFSVTSSGVRQLAASTCRTTSGSRGSCQATPTTEGDDEVFGTSSIRRPLTVRQVNLVFPGRSAGSSSQHMGTTGGVQRSSAKTPSSTGSNGRVLVESLERLRLPGNVSSTSNTPLLRATFSSEDQELAETVSAAKRKAEHDRKQRLRRL